MWTTVLPVARYRFTAVAQQPLALPPYAGSLLRGQFGAALRREACLTGLASCASCPLRAQCAYTRIFEALPPPKGEHRLQDFSQIPNPYVIEPPPMGMRPLAAGEALVFHLVLIGHALDALALVIQALQSALQRGLGAARTPLALQRVDWMDSQNLPLPVWQAHQPMLAAHPAGLAVPTHQQPGGNASEPACDLSKSIAETPDSTVPTTEKDSGLTLHFHTPLRLQYQGQPLGAAQLTPRTLVAALARRAALLMAFHAGQGDWGEAVRSAALAGAQLHDARALRWFDWSRYSSRQQQEMKLGGVVGQWHLSGPTEALALLRPWLWLGQWLHVGKNATMGLGAYTLQGGASTDYIAVDKLAIGG